MSLILYSSWFNHHKISGTESKLWSSSLTYVILYSLLLRYPLQHFAISSRVEDPGSQACPFPFAKLINKNKEVSYFTKQTNETRPALSWQAPYRVQTQTTNSNSTLKLEHTYLWYDVSNLKEFLCMQQLQYPKLITCRLMSRCTVHITTSVFYLLCEIFFLPSTCFILSTQLLLCLMRLSLPVKTSYTGVYTSVSQPFPHGGV